jgi:hypothetical protein
MANCPNCGAVLSCGCQRKSASDGKQGCVQCIPAYEAALKRRNAERSTTVKPGKPGSVTYSDPSLN